jgi:hypothetical protein
MNKDCAYARKNLRKYQRGHLFKYEQIRIARHLNACPVCRTEFQALKKIADTKQLLRDITPPESLGQRMKAGVSGLGKLKLLFYRPLWVVLIVSAGMLVYVNIIVPHQRDIEIENIEKTLPAVVASAPTTTGALSVPEQPQPATARQEAVQPPVSTTAPAASPVPAEKPLLITIVPARDEAIGRINEVLQGQAELGTAVFSAGARQISGDLMAKELLTLLNQIRPNGKVSYSRKRFETFPPEQPIPFVMRLKPTPKTEVQSPPSSPKVETPAEAAADNMPSSAPTRSAL